MPALTVRAPLVQSPWVPQYVFPYQAVVHKAAFEVSSWCCIRSLLALASGPTQRADAPVMHAMRRNN